MQMETAQLRPYHIKAVDAIYNALTRGQKRIVIEMVPGSGKGIVLAKTIESLQKLKMNKILIITSNLTTKEEIEHQIFTNYSSFINIENDNILIKNVNYFLNDTNKITFEYDIVILYDNLSIKKYNKVLDEEKPVVAFINIENDISKNPKKVFATDDIVFSYTLKDAINDGYMTPAMNTSVLETAIEVFSKNLLEQFGCIQIHCSSKEQNQKWDLILQKDNQRILVEYKYYKSQVVSLSVANNLLKSIIKRVEQKNSQEDIILLIVLSNIPSFQKEEIYKEYRIIVLDIENLVFYSKNNPLLFKQLSQITYFPIDQIKGRPSVEAEMAQLFLVSIDDKHLKKAEEESTKSMRLIQKLTNCPAGRENAKEYEEICEEILRYLLEANYFNRLTSQYKTNDNHFQMDLIGSLKITQNNDESMHPLWQMLVHHYNSHFVVFEFKNYTEKIDQNLIYITEKYLFNAALRNVAFIISRKGFSDAAKFAAESCLKEHGKLILDVTQDDLLKMLKSSDDNPLDYLLTKLEDFLMGISK